MDLTGLVDSSSVVPPYEQLRLGIIGRVQSGRILVGALIPSSRTLAPALGLSPATVERAYGLLADEGVLEARNGVGTFVASSGRVAAELAYQREADRMPPITQLCSDPGLVDSDSPVPVYEQLRSAIVARVRSGQLRAGAAMPTIRAFAASLSLSKGTVARTYRMLEDDGVIETRGRNGTFIASGASSAELAVGIARRTAADYLALTGQLGLNGKAAVCLLQEALQQAEARP